MAIVARHFLKQLIETNAKNSVFSVDFIKQDGTPRTMNCRLGVTSHMNPKPVREDNTNNRMSSTTFDHVDNLLGVFDMVNNGYRTINIDTVTRLAFQGQVYEVIG